MLAAASGRVLARSFHSVLQVGHDMIEQALGTGNVQITESEPQMTWKRMELSVMLEHVQAHVAPTDVDPGAGLQWLPKILSSPKVKRTGALLERVFMPCDMYFRYTRHKGGTPELKVCCFSCITLVIFLLGSPRMMRNIQFLHVEEHSLPWLHLYHGIMLHKFVRRAFNFCRYYFVTRETELFIGIWKVTI